jgi:GntR family transcriptional regulator
MILEKEYGISLKIAEQIFEPIIANEYESKMLSVKMGAPLMLIVRISYDEDGKAIEYAKDIYRGDRIRFISRSPKRIMDEQPSNSPII